MTLSARNRLEGVVTEIQFGGVMAHVVIRAGKNLIESVITKRSAEEMKLSPPVSTRGQFDEHFYAFPSDSPHGYAKGKTRGASGDVVCRIEGGHGNFISAADRERQPVPKQKAAKHHPGR